MPPRGSSEGLDFTPILTHYLFLSTSLVAIIGWLVAFIGQIAVNIQFGHAFVGGLWFAIWLQLFLILGVLYTLASDSIAMHRFQIATFGAVAIVFAVEGVNAGIFSFRAAELAMSAGWLLLALVDIIWVLYFTSEEDSLSLHIFNSLGTGGLSGPGRRRTRGGRAPSMVMGGGVGSGGMGNGGYGSPYGGGAGGYDPKLAPTTMGMGMGGGPPVMSGTTGSFSGPGSAADARSMRSMNRPISDASAPVMHSPQLSGAGELGPGPGSPLMGSGNAGVGAGGGPSLTNVSSPQDNGPESGQAYQAKALYAYTASPDDANEISFIKGEIMEILDKSGKWWQAKKSDGRIGIAPSNYLQII